MNILLTGGTGYIGSHAAVAFVEAGHKVVLFDNLSNSQRHVVDRIAKIVGHGVPFVTRVAVGLLPQLSVFGNDYPTPDGTGVRDYIHVLDLVDGRVSALNFLTTQSLGGCHTINLGTGQGYSVLEMVRAFEHASGQKVPYQIVARRPGDIASCYAKVDRAAKTLGWKARLGLADMCQSNWHFQQLLKKSDQTGLA